MVYRQWLKRTTKWVDEANKSQVAPFEKITGEEAAKLITSSTHEDEKALGFDATDAKRLGVKLGDTVGVMPTDNGNIFVSASVLKLVSYVSQPGSRQLDAFSP